MPSYVVKAEIRESRANTFAFPNMKTMYGGKHITVGDEVFLFASETEGGAGLIARGVVTLAEPTPPKRGVGRQTPRVSIEVKHTARVKRPFGRADLKPFRGLKDDTPEAELDFKFYRQATNKIGGISEEAARFLAGYLK
jgi:hypothetical protein